MNGFLHKDVKKFLLKCLKPFKGNIFWLFVIGSAWALDFSLKPVILKEIIDALAIFEKTQLFSKIVPMILLYSGLILGLFFAFRLFDYIWLKTEYNLVKLSFEYMLDLALHHSPNYLEKNFSGSLASRMQSVASAIPDLIYLIIHNFFSHFLAFLGAMLSFCFVNFKLALILTVWFIFFFSCSLVFYKKLKKMSATVAETWAQSFGGVSDVLGNIRSVKLFAARRREHFFVMRLINKYVEAAQDRRFFFLILYTFQGLSFVIYQSACVFLLVYGFQRGWFSYGDFALVTSVNITVVDCLWDFAEDLGKFSDYCGYLNQNLEILIKPIDIVDSPEAPEFIPGGGEICFDKVTFSYGNNAIFKDLTLNIKAGERVGLVGYSGAGKSTFVSLIMRFFDINSGSIKIDGQDISKVRQDTLRTAISFIPQDVSLFNRTIFQNISYGLDAKLDEVKNLAQLLCLDETIENSENGYNSLVGERGANLSGGQRQRILIARAFLSKNNIIIMDEPTASLDYVTEKAVRKSINELTKGKTFIVIAHRLSTLMEMDRIIVLDKGKVAQEGNHQELMKEDGIYKKMWDSI
jgi:ATP-binding cassette subfamily B protein